MKYLKPLYDLSKDINSISKNKIYYLIIFMLIFSLLYLLLDDDNFSGVNKYKETIKDVESEKSLERAGRLERNNSGILRLCKWV